MISRRQQQGKIKYLQHIMTSGQMTCMEITEKYLTAAEKENPKLNAIIRMTSDDARKAASETDKRLAAGMKLRPLEGIPMTLKDNISTAGIETTCCSKMLWGYKPIYDATVWSILKSQNAVLIGKTNMDEFAMGSSCETSCFGGTQNPLDTSRVAGGSSGGAAASVAGGMAVYALGSDTGGSVRQPASFCGLVGLKPTYGAVSRYGLIAYASGFDQIGPLAACVDDAAAVYDAIALYDNRDSTSTGSREPVQPALGRSIRGFKIGVIRECIESMPDFIRSAIADASEVFTDLGAEVSEISVPELIHALPAYYILACAEASSNLGRYDGIRYGYRTGKYDDIDEMICKTRSEGFGKEVRHRILLGTYVLSSGYYDAYYKKAQNLRGAIINAFDRIYEDYDVLILPTVPTTAFKSGYACLDPVETYATDMCTVPANIAGLPAISIPCGSDFNGMPAGLQIMGKRFCEADIFSVAYAYEAFCTQSQHTSCTLEVKL